MNAQNINNYTYPPNHIFGSHEYVKLTEKRLKNTIPLVFLGMGLVGKLGYNSTNSMLGLVAGGLAGFFLGSICGNYINQKINPNPILNENEVYDMGSGQMRPPTTKESLLIKARNAATFSSRSMYGPPLDL